MSQKEFFSRIGTERGEGGKESPLSFTEGLIANKEEAEAARRSWEIARVGHQIREAIGERDGTTSSHGEFSSDSGSGPAGCAIAILLLLGFGCFAYRMDQSFKNSRTIYIGVGEVYTQRVEVAVGHYWSLPLNVKPNSSFNLLHDGLILKMEVNKREVYTLFPVGHPEHRQTYVSNVAEFRLRVSDDQEINEQSRKMVVEFLRPGPLHLPSTNAQ